MLFDAVLLLSFGGPEGPEQVRPFLENVTRGRNVPPERLDEVAQHYLHFGGVSPINGINRALITELRSELDLPVYLGNRNWAPYVEDCVTPSVTRYVENIARPRRAAGPRGPDLVKLRPYFDHPLFVEMFAGAIAAAADTLPAELRGEARLVVHAHFITLGAA